MHHSFLESEVFAMRDFFLSLLFLFGHRGGLMGVFFFFSCGSTLGWVSWGKMCG